MGLPCREDYFECAEIEACEFIGHPGLNMLRNLRSGRSLFHLAALPLLAPAFLVFALVSAPVHAQCGGDPTGPAAVSPADLSARTRALFLSKHRLIRSQDGPAETYVTGALQYTKALEKFLADFPALPQAERWREDLANEYIWAGHVLRFQLGKPEQALSLYACAEKFNRSLALLAAADTYQFALQNKAKAIELYQGLLDSASNGSKNAKTDAAVLGKVWLRHQLAYLKTGKAFSGAISADDMVNTAAFLSRVAGWKNILPDPYDFDEMDRRPVSRTGRGGQAKSAAGGALTVSGYDDDYLALAARKLNSSAPSLYTLVRAFPHDTLFRDVDATLRFLSRNDPAGYAGACLLAAHWGWVLSRGVPKDVNYGSPPLGVATLRYFQQHAATMTREADAFTTKTPDKLELKAGEKTLTEPFKAIFADSDNKRNLFLKRMISLSNGYDPAMDLAAHFGKQGNVEVLRYLIDQRYTACIYLFATSYQGPSNPALEAVILDNRLDPYVGAVMLELIKKNTSRKMFDAFISDLAVSPPWFHRQYRARDVYAAAMKSELPGKDAALSTILGIPEIIDWVAKELHDHNYQAAEPMLYEALKNVPVEELDLKVISQYAVDFRSQRMHDLVAARMIELAGRRDERLNWYMQNFADSLFRGVPLIRLYPAVRQEATLALFAPAERAMLEKMIAARDARERRAGTLTPDNLVQLVKEGDTELVAYLISRKFDVNQPDGQGQRPLEIALKQRNWSMATVLVKAGADARLRLASKDTPLHVVVAAGPDGPRSGPESVEFMNALIAAGADVSAHGKNGLTPLHIAAHSNAPVPSMRRLIEAGADVNAKDSRDCTPLHLAVDRGWPEPVQYLVENHANVNAECEDLITGADGLTPLQIAFDHESGGGGQYGQIAKYLGSKGATVSQYLIMRRDLRLKLQKMFPGPVSH